MEGYKLNVEMAEELIPMLLYEMVNNDVITEEQANEVLNTVFDECLESNIEAKSRLIPTLLEPDTICLIQL